MIGRLLATTVMLLLAFLAFWGDAIGYGYAVAAFFLFFAVITWLKWQNMRDGFYAATGGSKYRSSVTDGEAGIIYRLDEPPPRHRSAS